MFLTLTELRYIIALAQERHFGKAAQKCFVSQPTLSIAIKKLEENLGIMIFERNKNKVMITEAGTEIIAQAQQVIDGVSKIQEFAKSNANPLAKPLKIGAIHTVGPYLFPKLITILHHTAPEMKLIIEEGFTSTLDEKLNAGELDAVILAKPFNKPNITIIELYQESLDLIIPARHSWREKTAIDPNSLDQQRLLLLGNGHCFRDQVLSICPQCNLNDPNTLSQMITTSSIETIKYMVAENLGISIVPRSALCNIDNNLILSKKFIDPSPTREIILAYRNSFNNSILINKLVEIIQTLPLGL